MAENPDLVKKYGIDEKRNLAPCGGGFGPVRIIYSIHILLLLHTYSLLAFLIDTYFSIEKAF